MKYFKLFTLLLISSALSFYSCKYNSSKQETSESAEVSNTVTPPTVASAEPDQNADGVWHWTCSKGCAGGAGGAGNCAVCGGPLSHNQAYHNNTNSAPANPSLTPSATPPSSMPPAAEPAQNAKGVWHFTCAKGCAGGAGALGNCAVCGGPLAHNQAYHQ